MNLVSHPGESQVVEPRASDTLGRLFHRLNNQLGIVLAHAEMLEEQAVDETRREHASRVVSCVVDALGTSREIRRLSDTLIT